MAIHLAVSRTERLPWHLLVLGTGILGIVDFARATVFDGASAETLWQVQAVRGLGLLALTAAIVHPARSLLTASGPQTEPNQVRVRASLLLLPLIVGPGILLIRGRGLDGNTRAVIVVSLLLGSVVIA